MNHSHALTSYRTSWRGCELWLETRKEKTDAVATTRGGRHHPEIPARQVRDRGGGRDHLYPRLGQDDAGLGELGGQECDARCRAEALGHRWHAVLPGRRLDVGDFYLWRSRDAPQLLHGCDGRRLVDRSARRH